MLLLAFSCCILYTYYYFAFCLVVFVDLAVFCLVLGAPVQFSYRVHISPVLLPILCVCWLFVGCFLSFSLLYWILIRCMAFCQASMHIYWCYCSFRVPLLSGAFYIALVFFFSICSRCLVEFMFLNVFEVAAVRESHVVLFTLLCVLRALFHGFVRVYVHSM